MGREQVVGEEDPAAAGWITRGEVARALGVAVASVRRLEGVRLHPARGEDGVWRFDPAEVSALAAERKQLTRPGVAASGSTDGEIAALVFRLFEEGKTFSAIVREVRLPPDRIRQLNRQWRAGFGDVEDDLGAEEDLELQRARDEREMLAWEKRMLDLQQRDDEIERRDRLERMQRRPSASDGEPAPDNIITSRPPFPRRTFHRERRSGAIREAREHRGSWRTPCGDDRA